MEIERKYLIEAAPKDYASYPFSRIQQGYLNISPVVRVRKEDEEYYLTYKGKGRLAREEYNLPLTKEAYEHLIKKADGLILTKRRYIIPAASQYPDPSLLPSPSLVIELDVFEGAYEGLMLAEVEFASLEEAGCFTPPSWFGRDVTLSGEYQNSRLSQNQAI